jgi:hypothetical protein
MRTDYTIPALAIPFLIAVACNLPACYTQNKTQPAAHICAMTDCVQIGNTSFKSDCSEGTDCYLFDLTHYNNPSWSYEQCETFVFGYGESIDERFGTETIIEAPSSNCNY